MTDFAKLVLDADTRGLKKGERGLKGVRDQSKKTANEVDRSANDMSASFKRVGLAIAASGIGLALVDFGKKSAQAAIDAEEMDSAFSVVFGNMADSVRMWAEETGNALGRSTQEIQRGALAFQELFGKSLDPAQAAEMSKQFAILTQDLASFKNLSNEVAQQKLFSGLVGEAEPLRAVGVFLSEAAVEAKAAQLGISGVNGALTDQQKIVVRAAIINEQLADAQGDVLRTAGSTANQIKAMNAAVEELQVAIGQQLLPQLTPLITLTAEFVTVLANAAQQISISDTEIKELTNGIRVIGGWIAEASRQLGIFSDNASEMGAQIDALARQAFQLVGPLADVVDLLRWVGREYGGTTSPGISLGFDEILSGAGNVELLSQKLGMVNTEIPKLELGVTKAGKAVKAANDNFSDLLDRMRPVRVESRQLAKDLALIDAQGFADAQRRALRFERVGGLQDPDVNVLESPEKALESITKASGVFTSELGKLKDTTETQTVAIARTFQDMSRDITSSMNQLASGIQGGGVLDILGGLVGLFTSLGSTGLFGQSLANNINQPRSFAGGGYTGSGPRSGGMDGKGGFLAMLHPQETVIDHTRGQKAANDVHVTVGIDPANGNITAFVDGQIAATAPAIAEAGAAMAQGQMAQSARRRYR